jgi:hypothetical protein
MVMVVVVIVMVVIVMMVMMVMMVVMVVMVVMVILSHYDRLFFRDGGVGGAFILGSQNVLCIRNGIQQLGE